MGPSTFINQKTTNGADYVILTNKTFYWCNKELSGTYIAKYVMDNVPNKITGREEILNVLEMAASKDPASIELGKKLILRCDFKNEIFTDDLIRSAFAWEYYQTSLLAEFYYYLLAHNMEA